MVGGTGLYLQAALTDLELRPPPDPASASESRRAWPSTGGPGAARRAGPPRPRRRRGSIRGPHARCSRARAARDGGAAGARRSGVAALDGAVAPPDAAVRPRDGTSGPLRAHRRPRGRDGRRRRGGPGPARPRRPAPRPRRAPRWASRSCCEATSRPPNGARATTRNASSPGCAGSRRWTRSTSPSRPRARRGADRPYTGRAARGGPNQGEICEALVWFAAVMAGFSLSAVPSAYAVRDYARTARNIIPSGQYGGVPVPPEGDRQAQMYDALTPLFDDVDNGDLFSLFKSEKLGAKGEGPLKTERPRKGVRIVRDALQRAAHLRQDRRRRDLRRGLGARRGPRAAARAGALQRPRRRHRRSRARGHRPDRRPQDVPAQPADRARDRQGGQDPAQALRPPRAPLPARHRRLRARASTPSSASRTARRSPGRATT